jgi:hypothetical protein
VVKKLEEKAKEWPKNKVGKLADEDIRNKI